MSCKLKATGRKSYVYDYLSIWRVRYGGCVRISYHWTDRLTISSLCEADSYLIGGVSSHLNRSLKVQPTPPLPKKKMQLFRNCLEEKNTLCSLY